MNIYCVQVEKRLYIQEYFSKFAKDMKGKNKTTTELLQESLLKESKKFTDKESKLSGTFAKFSKFGIDVKTNFNLPLKDTIGKTFREQSQFKSI